MNYRNAIASDLPEMQRLCIASCPDAASARQRQKDIIGAQLILIAQADNTIVGFGTLRDNRVDFLFVHQNYQQQGIAEELLSKLDYIAQHSNTTNKAAAEMKPSGLFSCPNPIQEY